MNDKMADLKATLKLIRSNAEKKKITHKNSKFQKSYKRGQNHSSNISEPCEIQPVAVNTAMVSTQLAEQYLNKKQCKLIVDELHDEEDLEGDAVHLITANMVLSPEASYSQHSDNTVDLYGDLMLTDFSPEPGGNFCPNVPVETSLPQEQNHSVEMQSSNLLQGSLSSKCNLKYDSVRPKKDEQATKLNSGVNSEETSKPSVTAARITATPTIAGGRTGDAINLFDDFIIKRNELQVNSSQLVAENKQLQERLDSVIEDYKVVLRNISMLWKTSKAQLKEKNKQINDLKREREALVFRRAMRQLGKDDLEQLLSRIAAFTPPEMQLFIKTVNSVPSTPSCSNCERTGHHKRLQPQFPATSVQSAVHGELLDVHVSEEAKQLLRLLPDKMEDDIVTGKKTIDVRRPKSNSDDRRLKNNSYKRINGKSTTLEREHKGVARVSEELSGRRSRSRSGHRTVEERNNRVVVREINKVDMSETRKCTMSSTPSVRMAAESCRTGKEESIGMVTSGCEYHRERWVETSVFEIKGDSGVHESNMDNKLDRCSDSKLTNCLVQCDKPGRQENKNDKCNQRTASLGYSDCDWQDVIEYSAQQSSADNSNAVHSVIEDSVTSPRKKSQIMAKIMTNFEVTKDDKCAGTINNSVKERAIGESKIHEEKIIEKVYETAESGNQITHDFKRKGIRTIENVESTVLIVKNNVNVADLCKSIIETKSLNSSENSNINNDLRKSPAVLRVPRELSHKKKSSVLHNEATKFSKRSAHESENFQKHGLAAPYPGELNQPMCLIQCITADIVAAGCDGKEGASKVAGSDGKEGGGKVAAGRDGKESANKVAAGRDGKEGAGKVAAARDGKEGAGKVAAARDGKEGAGNVAAARDGKEGAGKVAAARDGKEGAGKVGAARDGKEGAGNVAAARDGKEGAGNVAAARDGKEGAGNVAAACDGKEGAGNVDGKEGAGKVAAARDGKEGAGNVAAARDGKEGAGNVAAARDGKEGAGNVAAACDGKEGAGNVDGKESAGKVAAARDGKEGAGKVAAARDGKEGAGKVAAARDGKEGAGKVTAELDKEGAGKVAAARDGKEGAGKVAAARDGKEGAGKVTAELDKEGAGKVAAARDGKEGAGNVAAARDGKEGAGKVAAARDGKEGAGKVAAGGDGKKGAGKQRRSSSQSMNRPNRSKEGNYKDNKRNPDNRRYQTTDSYRSHRVPGSKSNSRSKSPSDGHHRQRRTDSYRSHRVSGIKSNSRSNSPLDGHHRQRRTDSYRSHRVSGSKSNSRSRSPSDGHRRFHTRRRGQQYMNNDNFGRGNDGEFMRKSRTHFNVNQQMLYGDEGERHGRGRQWAARDRRQAPFEKARGCQRSWRGGAPSAKGDRNQYRRYGRSGSPTTVGGQHTAARPDAMLRDAQASSIGKQFREHSGERLQSNFDNQRLIQAGKNKAVQERCDLPVSSRHSGMSEVVGSKCQDEVTVKETSTSEQIPDEIDSCRKSEKGQIGHLFGSDCENLKLGKQTELSLLLNSVKEFLRKNNKSGSKSTEELVSIQNQSKHMTGVDNHAGRDRNAETAYFEEFEEGELPENDEYDTAALEAERLRLLQELGNDQETPVKTVGDASIGSVKKIGGNSREKLRNVEGKNNSQWQSRHASVGSSPGGLSKTLRRQRSSHHGGVDPSVFSAFGDFDRLLMHYTQNAAMLDDTIDTLVKRHNAENHDASLAQSEMSLLCYLQKGSGLSAPGGESPIVSFSNVLELTSSESPSAAKSAKGATGDSSFNSHCPNSNDSHKLQLPAMNSPTVKNVMNTATCEEVRLIKRVRPIPVSPNNTLSFKEVSAKQVIEMVPIKEYSIHPKPSLPTSSVQVIHTEKYSFRGSPKFKCSAKQPKRRAKKPRKRSTDDEQDIANSDSSEISGSDPSDASDDSFIAHSTTQEDSQLIHPTEALEGCVIPGNETQTPRKHSGISGPSTHSLGLSLSSDDTRTKSSSNSNKQINICSGVSNHTNRSVPRQRVTSCSDKDSWFGSPAKNTRSKSPWKSPGRFTRMSLRLTDSMHQLISPLKSFNSTLPSPRKLSSSYTGPPTATKQTPAVAEAPVNSAADDNAVGFASESAVAVLVTTIASNVQINTVSSSSSSGSKNTLSSSAVSGSSSSSGSSSTSSSSSKNSGHLSPDNSNIKGTDDNSTSFLGRLSMSTDGNFIKTPPCTITDDVCVLASAAKNINVEPNVKTVEISLERIQPNMLNKSLFMKNNKEIQLYGESKGVVTSSVIHSNLNKDTYIAGNKILENNVDKANGKTGDAHCKIKVLFSGSDSASENSEAEPIPSCDASLLNSGYSSIDSAINVDTQISTLTTEYNESKTNRYLEYNVVTNGNDECLQKQKLFKNMEKPSFNSKGSSVASSLGSSCNGSLSFNLSSESSNPNIGVVLRVKRTRNKAARSLSASHSNETKVIQIVYEDLPLVKRTDSVASIPVVSTASVTGADNMVNVKESCDVANIGLGATICSSADAYADNPSTAASIKAVACGQESQSVKPSVAVRTPTIYNVRKRILATPENSQQPMQKFRKMFHGNNSDGQLLPTASLQKSNLAGDAIITPNQPAPVPSHDKQIVKSVTIRRLKQKRTGPFSNS